MDRKIQSSANSSGSTATKIVPSRLWGSGSSRTLFWKCYLSIPRSPSEMMPTPLNTRRWPRHQVVLPVRIVALNRCTTTPALARGSAISRAGMALHVRIAATLGDLLQLQFPTSPPTAITAVVRNRTGDYLGVEFLAHPPMPSEETDRSKLLRSSVLGGSPELRQSVRASSCASRDLSQTAGLLCNVECWLSGGSRRYIQRPRGGRHGAGCFAGVALGGTIRNGGRPVRHSLDDQLWEAPA